MAPHRCAEEIVVLADDPADRRRRRGRARPPTEHRWIARRDPGKQPPACRAVLDVEQVVAAGVGEPEHLGDLAVDVDGDAGPVEVLVRQRPVIEGAERLVASGGVSEQLAHRPRWSRKSKGG